MIQAKVLPFGEWLPDQPDLGNAVTVVNNAIPQAQSYRSIKELTAFTNALTGACVGGFWAQDSDGTFFSFAGDATKLYSLSGDTYTDVSKAGGYSGVTRWEFLKWGDRVIAVSIGEETQYYDMGISALFAALPGSPPKAKTIAAVRDFIVMGNLDDGTARPSRLQWGGYNSSELWTSSLATQGDYQDLFGNGGAIQKITPGEIGYIFQERAIRRMTYVGPPKIFQIDEVETARGAFAANSVIWYGSLYFYYARDGFYMFDGQSSIPIGVEKIDRHFLSDFDTTDTNLMRGAIDRKNKVAMWVYPSISRGRNCIIAYCWDVQRWGFIDQSAEILLENASAGYTLDGLDAIFTDIDADSFNMESDAYKGGDISLTAFDTSHKLASFSGDELSAEIETGEMMPPNGMRVSIKSARPLLDGDATLQLGVRDNQNDNFSYGTAQSENSKGEMNFRSSARYHRVKATVTGGAKQINGVEVFFRLEGRQ